MDHLYFVRHGQSVANANKIIADADSLLTQLGLSQAKEAAGLLKSLDIDLIISSPMTRAKETAEVIAESIGYDKSKILTIDDLKERGLGDLENEPKNQESRWYFDTANGLGMETHQELCFRMKRVLTYVLETYRDYSNILISGHSISGDMLRLISDNKSDFTLLADYELTKNAGYFELNIQK
ncbi:MAG: histidine phosphatase family protein [bacterium]|nr:histidine phosphatase family protein [bacterium]